MGRQACLHHLLTALEVVGSQTVSMCVVGGHFACGQAWTSPGCLCTSIAVPKATMGRDVYCCGIETSFAIDLLLPAWSDMRTNGPKAGLTLTDEDPGGRGKNLWPRRWKSQSPGLATERMVAGQQRSSTETGFRSPHTNAGLPMGSQVSAGLNEVCLMKEEPLASSKETEPSGWKDNTLGTEDLEPLIWVPASRWLLLYTGTRENQKYIACWGMVSVIRQHFQQSSCIVKIRPFQEEFNSPTTHAICSYEMLSIFCRR